jgi:hypothetical protein
MERRKEGSNALIMAANPHDATGRKRAVPSPAVTPKAAISATNINSALAVKPNAIHWLKTGPVKKKSEPLQIVTVI